MATQQQGVIAPADPGAAVGGGEQGVDLLAVRKDTTARSQRLGGMASTRWISSACSGWRSAAYLQ